MPLKLNDPFSEINIHFSEEQVQFQKYWIYISLTDLVRFKLDLRMSLVLAAIKAFMEYLWVLLLSC
jgi:hypothetical protein